MIGLLLVLSCTGVLSLIMLGSVAEIRHQTVNVLLLNLKNSLQNILPALNYARLHHPNPPLAVLETIFWLLMLIPMADHVLNPNDGSTASWIWFLTIGPHEIGHVICMPFGQFLMVAGGSFWQLFFWGGLAVYTLFVHRRIGRAAFMWLITGHSFINLSVYIRDARSRDLELLFGLDENSHDWWNLLRWTGLLEYDHVIADISVITGVLTVLTAILVGFLTAWLLPRTGTVRYHGFLWSALANTIQQSAHAQKENVAYGEIVK